MNSLEKKIEEDVWSLVKGVTEKTIDKAMDGNTQADIWLALWRDVWMSVRNRAWRAVKHSIDRKEGKSDEIVE
jgi:hypothetical protein